MMEILGPLTPEQLAVLRPEIDEFFQLNERVNEAVHARNAVFARISRLTDFMQPDKTVRLNLEQLYWYRGDLVAPPAALEIEPVYEPPFTPPGPLHMGEDHGGDAQS